MGEGRTRDGVTFRAKKPVQGLSKSMRIREGLSVLTGRGMRRSKRKLNGQMGEK